MSNMYARVYRSFQDFERAELRKLDYMYESVDDMMDELMLSELDDDKGDEDGILFDQFDEVEDDVDEDEGFI